jgi:type VII secretion integral membrane protein EccD
MTTGLARVTISAAQRRLDVALPEQVPLAELLPEVLRHAGEGLADDGERHGGWVLRRTDGAVLATAQALLPQGVRDGEVLHLVPARAQWPELAYDDVVEVIADGARRRGAAWSPAATRAATLVGAGVPLAVGLVAVLAVGPGQRTGWPVAVAVALLLVLAGTAASRAYGDGPAGATLGGYALPWAAAAGALAVGTGDPVGPFAPLRWVGAPELLAGSVALLLVSVLGLLGVASRGRVFVAGATAGAAGATAALGGCCPGWFSRSAGCRCWPSGSARCRCRRSPCPPTPPPGVRTACATCPTRGGCTPRWPVPRRCSAACYSGMPGWRWPPRRCWRSRAGWPVGCWRRSAAPCCCCAPGSSSRSVTGCPRWSPA